MDGNNQKKGFFATLFSDGLKSAWALLPLPVKIQVIAISGGVFLLFIVIAGILALNPFNFLNYSNDTVSTDNFEETYEDYWTEFCDSYECTEEQKNQVNEIKNSQTKFFERLDKLANKHNLTKRQKYLVLSTIFYDYDIENFTEGSAYNFDSEDAESEHDDETYEDNNGGSNAYSEEYDTIKELIKQLKAYTATCTQGDQVFEYQKSDGSYYTYNFFKRFTINVLGTNGGDNEIAQLRDDCNSKGGSFGISKSYKSAASEDAYFNYLVDSEYFDKRYDHLKDYYINYAKAHDLDQNSIDGWSESDKKAVRRQIADNIKDIVDDYEKYSESKDSNTLVTICTSTDFWWPVGSNETTEINGATFATGAPALATNPSGNSRFLPDRWGKPHNGIDIGSGGKIGVYNIIAPKSGTVEYVFNGCADNGYYGNPCGGYRGNQVYINHGDGTYSRAQHMAKNSVTVKVGDVVKQGQVIGKIGKSGSCKGAHLHFEIKINNGATYVDPMKYIDANNPRPGGGSTCGEEVNFTSTSLTKEEFVTKLKNFYSNDNCNSTSSQYSKGCGSFKSQILNNNGAEIIYEVAKEHNKNPELIVARSRLEGYSPGNGYNYFGYRCYNGKSASTCRSFSSFREGVDTFFSNADGYDTLTAMMSKYGYIGDYWYAGGSGSGGCYYYEHIKEYMSEERARTVGSWCPQGCNTCATNDEDQSAYAEFQVNKMAEQINKIFK